MSSEKQFAHSTWGDIEKIYALLDDLTNKVEHPVARDEIKRLRDEMSVVSQNLISLIDSYTGIVNHIDLIMSNKKFGLSKIDKETLVAIKRMIFELYDTVADD